MLLHTVGVETIECFCSMHAGGVYAWNGKVRARDTVVEKGGSVAGEARASHGKASSNKTTSRADARPYCSVTSNIVFVLFTIMEMIKGC